MIQLFVTLPQRKGPIEELQLVYPILTVQVVATCNNNMGRMHQINGPDSRDCTKSATNESETVTDIFHFSCSFSLRLSWQRSNTLSIASELEQPQVLVFDPSLVV